MSPRRGICSEVMGMVSETLSWNTVRLSRTVTPGKGGTTVRLTARDRGSKGGREGRRGRWVTLHFSVN